MSTPIRRLLLHVDNIGIPLVISGIPDPQTPRNLVQEERRNEELNKRFVEELERRRQLDEIRNRFLGNAAPPSGIEPRVQPPQQQRNLQEDDLEKALKRLEELRQREAELFERLDRWRVPRLSELPVPPIRLPELRLSETPELPPWERRWAFKPIPKPLPLPRLPPLGQRHREAVLA